MRYNSIIKRYLLRDKDADIFGQDFFPGLISIVCFFGVDKCPPSKLISHFRAKSSNWKSFQSTGIKVWHCTHASSEKENNEKESDQLLQFRPIVRTWTELILHFLVRDWGENKYLAIKTCLYKLYKMTRENCEIARIAGASVSALVRREVSDRRRQRHFVSDCCAKDSNC